MLFDTHAHYDDDQFDGDRETLLASLPAKRKILIHINNTNPILNEQSPQRQALTQQGIEVSWDGMAITLQDTAC